jgi:hypothetical protein
MVGVAGQSLVFDAKAVQPQARGGELGGDGAELVPEGDGAHVLFWARRPLPPG